MINNMMGELNNIYYEGTPEINSNDVLLQQDGAPSHTA